MSRPQATVRRVGRRPTAIPNSELNINDFQVFGLPTENGSGDPQKAFRSVGELDVDVAAIAVRGVDELGVIGDHRLCDGARRVHEMDVRSHDPM